MDLIYSFQAKKLRFKAKDRQMYFREDNKIFPARIFTDSLYNLKHEGKFIYLEIDGIKMHVTSTKNYARKVASFFPKTGGFGLDVCTGLGYVAKELLKKVDFLYTIEKAWEVIYLAKKVPESRDLFKAFKEGKAKLFVDDAFTLIEKKKNDWKEKFSIITLDPPRFSFAPLLYSEEFYKNLYYVAKKGSFFYTYVGDPYKRRRKPFYSSIIPKLKNAGWSQIRYSNELFGIFARKL